MDKSSFWVLTGTSCFVILTLPMALVSEIGEFAAILSMAIIAIVCYVAYKYWKNKEDKDFINTHVGNITAKLREAKIEKITYDAIYNLEQKACKNINAPLNKYKLSISDFHDTKSSLGYCAYKHGYLLTSFEVRSTAQNPYMSQLDLVNYFTQPSPFIEEDKIRKFAKYIGQPNTENRLFRYELIELEKYVSIISDAYTHNFKIAKLRAIKQKDVEYYKVEGTSQYVSYVQGGGANLPGAVYGAVLAGGAGAIVGSKVKADIKTNIVRKDDRKLFLYYNINGVVTSEEIIAEDIDYILSILRGWIPEKEYSHIISKNIANPVVNGTLPYQDSPKDAKQTASASHSYAELKELKELLDLGIITQEEFDRKKREILG